MSLPSAALRKELRLAVRVTVREAAAEAGVTERTYIRWENGSEPNFRNARAYSALLGKWAQELTERREDPAAS